MNINRLVINLNQVAEELKKAGRKADSNRVLGVSKLLENYDLSKTDIKDLGSALLDKKPKRKTASIMDSEESKKRIGVIVHHFQSRNEDQLKEVLNQRATTFPIVKEACMQLGYGFKKSKKATNEFLVGTIREANKQKVRH